MAVEYTPDQKRAIEAKGKVIVSASAGSGKTAVMIEKIIRLIRSGVHVNEILAVTFTKKAAAQMKEKLSRALISGINADKTTAEERKMLKERLAEVPTADISTIHSFCSKLIKTHFYEAQTDNSFRIISSDDAEGVALKNQALDELFEEGYENKDADFTHLLSVYWRKKSDNALKTIFLEGYEKLRNRADYSAYLNACGQYTEDTFNRICEDLKGLLFEKCKYYRTLIEREWKFFLEIGWSAQDKLCGQLVEWVDEILSCRDYFAVKDVKKPEKFAQNRAGKENNEERQFHVERLKFLKERLVSAVDKEMEKYESREEELARFLRSGETARALAVCFKRFDEKYTALKQERGVLDYNDLEHKTLKLLNDKEILQEIHEKYRYVFVDEYQDVNPVQEAITSKVAGENLFLVGDVKQSIYGFRGSKSQFFIDKQAAYAAGEGQSLEMRMNFRSSDAVLDAVNSQFSLAMTEELFGIDYKNKSFMENGEFASSDGKKKRIYEPGSGRAQVHFVKEGKEAKTEERGVYSVRANAKKRKGNIGVVARRIRNIIEEERSKEWYDPEKGKYVRVDYSDIAILSRKKSGQIAETVAALAAEGVPVTSASAVNVCEYAEVKTLIDLLSLLDNAEQDIPLCSVLLSAIGGLDVNDLTEIRLAYQNEKTAGSERKTIAYRDACKRYATEKTDDLSEKLQGFYAYFAKLRKLADVLNAGELLTKVIAETRMEAELLTRENGEASLRRLRRFVEATAEPEPMSVHEFLARLRDMDYTIEYNENGGENSVKALTMHSSKGLEYPVVIVDNLSQNFRGVDHDEVFVEEKYGLAPRAFDEKSMTKATTVLRVLHEKKETLSSIADELNLYYVALTRAKYALHMIFEKRTVMPDVKYARNCAEFTDFSVWEKFVPEYSEIELEKQERDPIAFKPDEQKTREIMSAFLWKYGYAGYENLPVKSSATMLMKGDNFSKWQGQVFDETEFGKENTHRDDEIEWSGRSAQERENAQAIGTAYHAFLETFDFGRLYGEGGVRLRGSNLESAVEETLSSLDTLTSDLLNKEQLIRILSCKAFDGLQDMRLYPEQDFLASLPVSETYGKRADATEAWKAENGEKMLFQGAIDLLAVSDDEVRIIDYKYSDRNAESLKEHYQSQLDLYRKAVASILKKEEKKVRCTIINIKHCFELEMD